MEGVHKAARKFVFKQASVRRARAVVERGAQGSHARQVWAQARRLVRSASSWPPPQRGDATQRRRRLSRRSRLHLARLNVSGRADGLGRRAARQAARHLRAHRRLAPRAPQAVSRDAGDHQESRRWAIIKALMRYIHQDMPICEPLPSTQQLTTRQATTCGAGRGGVGRRRWDGASGARARLRLDACSARQLAGGAAVQAEQAAHRGDGQQEEPTGEAQAAPTVQRHRRRDGGDAADDTSPGVAARAGGERAATRRVPR